MSGFFMIRQDVVRELPTLQRSGFKLLLEILVRAPLRDVQEVPFNFGARQGGESKAGFSVLRDYCTLLARLYWSHLVGIEPQKSLDNRPTITETVKLRASSGADGD